MTTVTTLLAAAVGGIIALLGVFLTNRSTTARLKMQLEHEAQKERTELLRTRGEELYELSDKWYRMVASEWVSLSFVMQGKITYNQHLDLTNDRGKTRQDYFGRIEMLIDVYFPLTRPAYDKMLSGRDEMNKVVAAHKQAYKDGDTDGERFLKPYTQRVTTLEQAGNAFKAEVMNCMRALDTAKDVAILH